MILLRGLGTLEKRMSRAVLSETLFLRKGLYERARLDEKETLPLPYKLKVPLPYPVVQVLCALLQNGELEGRLLRLHGPAGHY